MPDKERERRYLSELQKCDSGVPSGDVVETESPDFILDTKLGRIGVEFTEFHLSPPPGTRPHQEIQSLKDRVVKRAEQLHAEAGGPPLYATVIFGNHGRLSKATVDQIAHALADAVLFEDVPRICSSPSIEIPRSRLPHEVAHVRVNASVDGRDRLWQADAGGWVTQILVGDVQQEISRKERVYFLSRTKCDRVWLVIVHNLVRGAPAELADDARVARYQSSFDRVLWLDPHMPRVTPLYVGKS